MMNVLTGIYKPTSGAVVHRRIDLQQRVAAGAAALADQRLAAALQHLALAGMGRTSTSTSVPAPSTA
jgi:ABC-type branched-subunit amino acid transport system ATPase component